MTMKRREKREAVFLLVYQSILNDDSIEALIQANIEEFELTAEQAEVEWVTAFAKAVNDNAANADEIINKYSTTRRVERIAAISVAVMRLALYEMDCVAEEEVPDKVAINEAIELCKKYAGAADSKFVSGLLGSYYRSKHGEE